MSTTEAELAPRRSITTLVVWTITVFTLSLVLFGSGVVVALILAATKYRGKWGKIAVLAVAAVVPLILIALSFLLDPVGSASSVIRPVG